MKKIKWMPVIAVLVTSLLMMPGCKDPSGGVPITPVPVVKTELNAEIAAAKTILEDTVVSVRGYDVATGTFWYTASDKEALEDAIGAAEAVADNPNATKNQVDVAVYSLTLAIEAAKEARSDGISYLAESVLEDLIDDAEASRDSVSVSTDDGNDVLAEFQWVTQEVKETFDAAITDAKEALSSNEGIAAAIDALTDALAVFEEAKASGKLVLQQHDVIFNYSDGSPYTTLRVYETYHIEKPADPGWRDTDQPEITEAGLYRAIGTFDGWYRENNTAWNFTTDTVSAPITLTARWNTDTRVTTINANDFDAALAYISIDGSVTDFNTVIPYILAISTDVSSTGATTGYNLRNAKLSIRALGEDELTISLSQNGSILRIYDAVVTLENNITLQGRADNNSPLVFTSVIDRTSASGINGIETIRTVFTMLAGSKLTGNTVTGVPAATTAGIDIQYGLLYVKGGEISNNHLEWANPNDPWDKTGGIHSSYGDMPPSYLYPSHGKVFIENGSVITGNTFGFKGDGTPPTMTDMVGGPLHNRDIRIGYTNGRGGLTVSGNVQIGGVSMAVMGGQTAIAVAGPLTGSVKIIETYSGGTSGSYSVSAPIVYGTDTYQLTQEDISRFTPPSPYSGFGVIANNSVTLTQE